MAYITKVMGVALNLYDLLQIDDVAHSPAVNSEVNNYIATKYPSLP